MIQIHPCFTVEDWLTRTLKHYSCYSMSYGLSETFTFDNYGRKSLDFHDGKITIRDEILGNEFRDTIVNSPHYDEFLSIMRDKAKKLTKL